MRFYWTTSWLVHMAIIIRHTNPAWIWDMMGEVYLVCAYWFWTALVQLLNKNTPSIYIFKDQNGVKVRVTAQLTTERHRNGNFWWFRTRSEFHSRSSEHQRCIPHKKYHSSTEYLHICKLLVPHAQRQQCYIAITNIWIFLEFLFRLFNSAVDRIKLFSFYFFFVSLCTMHMMNCNPIWELAVFV